MIRAVTIPLSKMFQPNSFDNVAATSLSHRGSHYTRSSNRFIHAYLPHNLHQPVIKMCIAAACSPVPLDFVLGTVRQETIYVPTPAVGQMRSCVSQLRSHVAQLRSHAFDKMLGAMRHFPAAPHVRN